MESDKISGYGFEEPTVEFVSTQTLGQLAREHLSELANARGLLTIIEERVLQLEQVQNLSDAEQEYLASLHLRREALLATGARNLPVNLGAHAIAATFE